uniref:cilia- and flagella-associated protein 65 n=1 Tax=Euleptes europaea TaxID=460621 RepID=UPI00253F8AB1|nr:cilia- and flagella-associated protein 65 [Euleptes europaea]
MLTQVHSCTSSSDPLQRLCHGGPTQKVAVPIRRPLVSTLRKTKERSTFWGIEVVEAVCWHRWCLGKEFIKHLTLKNICLKTQKLRFRPPATRFFTTIFPQSIILSPGMSLTLPIIFRPLEKKEYEDSILFEKPEGKFSVVLCAKLPRFSLLFPDSLHLPYCAVYDCTWASFILHNDGDVHTCFSWEAPTPFNFIPSRGMLDPGQECKIKVTFQPHAALVHDVSATCSFGETQEQKSMRLTAVAKYPHLVVNVPGDSCEDAGRRHFRDVLCFGPAAVGSTAERYVEICNMSVVNAPFRIERSKELMLRDCDFCCDVTQATVSAGGKFLIPLHFSPQIVGMNSVDYFTIAPAGNVTQSVLKLTGSCKGPGVSLQHPFVYFSCINLGESLTQPLDITNISDVPAYYQFDIDCRQSIFSFDHPCGILAGMSTVTLKVTFQPMNPMIYYRRVVCLVHHQDPLFLDMFGTCHSDTMKPEILKLKDLTRYRTHMARGLTFYPPDVLGTMLKEDKLLLDENGALTLPPEMLEDKPPEEYPSLEPMVEYFHDGVNSDLTVFPPHVNLSNNEFDFGCCAKLQNIQPLPLCLTNCTKGKITVKWTNKPESPFQVAPESCDIPPLKSMAFCVIFQPPQLNSLYAAELEGFAFYKVLRHYSNIEEPTTMCPSWSFTIRLCGHTFEPGRQHFTPQYTLDCYKVFPPVCQNTNTYSSMLLCNTGTTAIVFNMSLEKCPSVLVKPQSGFIAPGAHQIFFLSTCPQETSVLQHSLSLHLNFSPSFTKEIILQSSAEPLVLLLEGDGSLYFKPTCVGLSSSHTFTIKNSTRLPMFFRWKIQQSDKKFLSVQPAEGTILPNEALAQTWTFTPREETKYLLRAWVTAWRDQETLGDKSPESVRYPLRVIGEGALATITALEEQVDVGSILVGRTQSCELVLLNNGACSLKYILSVEQTITGPCDPEEFANDPLAITLDHYRGTIPARGKILLQAVLSLVHRLHYTWTVFYALSTVKAMEPLVEKQPVCRVTATGIYPSICVTDVCGTGSARGINKLHLWRLFSLETLNRYLERDPTSQELTFRVPTRHSTQRIPTVYTPVMLDFNFGAAPVGSEPSTVVLMLQNSGAMPVNWAFLFPSDQKIDVEYWAESAEFDPNELQQMRIQDNQLFSICPKAGNLLPGQVQTIRLSHRHDFIGTDRLPVLLKVSHGREILLNFIGVTLELEYHYIHYTSTKHVFTPIAIGTCDPPKQIYELYNGGATKVVYEIQVDALMKVQEENHQHAVFLCLQPKGEIGPGLTAHTEWIFSPLEAKMYSVDVPIHILEGDSALITFQGVGYDPHVMREAAQFDKVVSPVTAPGSAKLTVPGLAVYLSQPQICFGNIPVYSKCSRLFFLNNTSEKEAIVFTWYIGTSNATVVLNIVPETGIVLAGESTCCVLTLHASETPCFYDVDLVCEIFTQRPLDQYEKELKEWETEKARQAVEFTITEKDLNMKKNGEEHAKVRYQPPGSGPGSEPLGDEWHRSFRLAEEPGQDLQLVLKLPFLSGQVVVLLLQKTAFLFSGTLPPIKNNSVPNPPASRSQRRQMRHKEARKLWAKPEPPLPFLMHLGVTARSHSVDDFLDNFSGELPQHFLYRQLKTTAARNNASDKTLLSNSRNKQRTALAPSWQELTNCSKQEAQLVTDVLSTVIKGLLEETQFHEAVMRSIAEPTPYFCQFWSEESAKLQDKKQSSGTSPTTPSPEVRRGEEDTQREEVSPSGTSDAVESLSVIIRKEHFREERETILRMPAYANLTEMVLDNTIQNILVEASRGEVVLTARPRIIALPPLLCQTFQHKLLVLTFNNPLAKSSSLPFLSHCSCSSFTLLLLKDLRQTVINIDVGLEEATPEQCPPGLTNFPGMPTWTSLPTQAEQRRSQRTGSVGTLGRVVLRTTNRLIKEWSEATKVQHFREGLHWEVLDGCLTLGDPESVEEWIKLAALVETLLGSNWLAGHNPSIDWDQQRIVFGAPQCERHGRDNIPRGEGGDAAAIEALTLPPEYSDFVDLFEGTDCDLLPPHHKTVCAIELTKDIKPSKARVYPMGPQEKAVLREFLDKNLERGFI